jgi:hypothetical protein
MEWLFAGFAVEQVAEAVLGRDGDDARGTSTIWLYTSGRLFTSQAVRIENSLGCPRLFGPPVMY